MPAGLVNILGSRQQFLDLVRYLIEIAEQGPARARALRPDPALVSPPLPDYERRLDHAGMIAGLGPKDFRRGEAIYRPRLRQLPRHQGPARFAADRRSASPPRRSRTAAIPTPCIARSPTASARWRRRPGWSPGRSTTSSITSARRTSRRTIPAQYAAVDRAYLDRLPKGTTRGPAPSAIEPWVAMDYGPSLMATYEVGNDGSNFAYKGIAVRLDPGQGGVSRGQRLDALRPRHAAPGGCLDRPGLHRLERHQLQRPAPGPSPDRRPASTSPTRTVPAGPIPNTGTLQRPAPPRAGRPALRAPAALLGALQGALPPRQPGDSRLHRRRRPTSSKRPVGRSIRRSRSPIFTRTLEIGPSTDDLLAARGFREGRRQPRRRWSGDAGCGKTDSPC